MYTENSETLFIIVLLPNMPEMLSRDNLFCFVFAYYLFFLMEMVPKRKAKKAS